MTLFVHLFVLFSLLGLSYLQTQSCNSSSWPPELTIVENTLNGTLIITLSDQDDVVFSPFSSSDAPSFIDIRNGSLYLNATVDLDGNEDLCAQFKRSGLWTLYVQCQSGPLHQIGIFVTVTNDYNPEFRLNYSETVQELALNNTLVHDIGDNDIEDKDCDSRFYVGGSSRFLIEGGNGNGNGAFRIQNVAGDIFLDRILDYENGDTHFVLNISVSDSDWPLDGKSYTTLEVTVIDVDDNDPVFNHTRYVLHVTENNNTAVGVWTVTDPPIGVYDPDVDVSPKDPLTISLYDSQKSSLLEVNETSGEVRLMQILDHEINQSVPVILKVQQTVNDWRSSTVTLTVIVDDVNDNRPAFDNDTYAVTIDEHLPVDTIVTVLSATDPDTGDNAVFSYTLPPEEDKFYIDTEQLGNQLYGYLRVRDSSLLDYENKSQITVTVGTVELMPEAGGSCSGVHCYATVNINLTDINDNSPVFTNGPYDITVENATQGTPILTVSATDADEGQNAKVTYNLQYYGTNVECTYVTMNDTTGVVTLNSTVQRSVTCFLFATACDNPAVQTQRRCTSVPLQVRLVVSEYAYSLLARDVDKADLDPHQAEIESGLSGILNADVAIESIEGSTGGSNVIISGTSGTTGDPLTREELGQLAAAKDEEIQELFQRFRSSTTTEEQPPADGTNDDEDFSPLVITLIVVAAVLLVAFIIAIIVIFRGHSSQKRQKRLLQRLSTTNDLYNDPELGKSETNSTDPILPTFGDDDDDDNQGRPEGVINPIFEDDDESLPQVTPRSDSDDALDEDRETGEAGGAHTEGPSRLTDADSGVPSDRENGAGDSESEGPSQDMTPVLARSEESVGRAGGSSYLDAVLTSQYLTSAEEISPGEMFDVTSPPPPADYDGDFSADPEPGPSEVPDYPEPGPSEIPDYPEPAESPRDVGDVHLENQEEQETVMTFGEDEAGELSAPPPDFPPPPPPIAPPPPPPPSNPSGPLSLAAFLQAQIKGGNAEDDEKDDDDKEKEEEDDDEPFSSSKLGMLVRPSTPPMQRSRSRQEEEEEEEELPDEPEPDYAKKVRFSVQVTEHTEDEPSQEERPEDEAGEEEEESASEAEVQPPGSKPVEEIDGSPLELGEEDEPTFHFNVQEELTVF